MREIPKARLNPDGRLELTVSVTMDEFLRAARRGRLVIPLAAGQGAAGVAGDQETGTDATGRASLPEAALARFFRRYGPASNGANALWEFAQAGEGGLYARDLRHALGLASSAELAGVMRGLWTSLTRDLAGFEDRVLTVEWDNERGENRYYMTAEAARAVVAFYGD